jgi:thiamine biosynthesis lipoprotein
VRPAAEAIETFPCFGATCSVRVTGATEAAGRLAARSAKRRLQEWHRQFSRFEPASELRRLNEDPRRTVRVVPLMARLAEAVHAAGAATGGLVDATLVSEIERAGYNRHLESSSLPLREALERAPDRRPAAPSSERCWSRIEVDRERSVVGRPPGVLIDSGGLAKGLFADVLAAALREHDAFAVDCAGDLRLGGARRIPRTVRVASPFDDSVLEEFEVAAGAVATSGIGRRSWLDSDGRPAHHLLDPASGRPAFTGIVQATAFAPTALEAEWRAKAALLAGPEAAPSWLPDGGVLVRDDGSHSVVGRPGIHTSDLDRA